jgi:hypothetical protein
MYLGDFKYGQTIYIPFATYGTNGESLTMSGLATTDIEVYKNGSVTQRASDAGYTLLDTDGIDFDGETGIHGCSIDTSDNTTAGFWGPGNEYMVVFSTITVNAQTVRVLRTFSIENRGGDEILNRTTIATLASQTSFTLTAGSADNDAYNGCTIIVHDAGSVVQKAVGLIRDYTGASKTVTLQFDPAVFTMAVGDYATIKVGNFINQLMDDGTATFDRTTDSLQAFKDAVSTDAQLADAVWDEARSGHVSAGSFGEGVKAESLNTQAKADVNAEVVDALATDTYAEPGQATPAATLSLAAKINYLFKSWRNRKTQTSTTWSLYNDDATTVAQKATVSDNGTTAEKTEITTGP